MRTQLLHVEYVGHGLVDLRRRAGQRHQDQASGQLRVVLRHPVERRAPAVGLSAHWAVSMMRTSTGAFWANMRASCSVPMCEPQCIGTATRGWILRAASAASCAVIT